MSSSFIRSLFLPISSASLFLSLIERHFRILYIVKELSAKHGDGKVTEALEKVDREPAAEEIRSSPETHSSTASMP